MIITLHGRRQLLDRTGSKLCLSNFHFLASCSLKITKQMALLLCQHYQLSLHWIIMFSYWDSQTLTVKGGIHWELLLSLSWEPMQPNLNMGHHFPRLNAWNPAVIRENLDISLFTLLVLSFNLFFPFAFLPTFPNWQHKLQTFPPHAVS